MSARVRLYAFWTGCIKTNCPEAINGKCGRASVEGSPPGTPDGELPGFPDDGRCLYADYFPYDPEIAALGAYETEEAGDDGKEDGYPFENQGGNAE
jgi:hypothetical protein